MDHGTVQPLAEGSKSENGRVTDDDYRQDGGSGKSSQSHNLMSQSRTRGESFIGKHRLQAAISHLNNEITIIEEELEKLETMDKSSSVCQELISSVESIPDPLLPWIKGSLDCGWDRWFGGAQHSRSHKRWI
ncbi:hypothetical protein K1719_022083 [Acacia pycnantha]|nr:hypothetical protein K1719_022083 [Acacia pycnantha]